MIKALESEARMVRSPAGTQLPSVGMSVGASGSDVFHITLPLPRKSLAIFCDLGAFTQYAKNLVIVMSVAPLLVMTARRSLGFGFVRGPSVTDGQMGFVGARGV